MKFGIVFIFLCSAYAIVSADIYGDEVTVTEQWWHYNYFLKFNSPSGKTFYIDFVDGTISREKKPDLFFLPSRTPPSIEKNIEPFISFVAINLKIYDIYFENDDSSNIPRLEQSKNIYEPKYILVRHRLTAFVGPNKKLYKVNYEDGIEPNITMSESSEALDKFQIKTFGAFEKWEHSYDFSETGDIVVDHTLSPIPLLPNRSIQLPKLKSDEIFEKSYIFKFVTFNVPSGIKYHITSQLNIIPVLEEAEEAEATYITFTEPNGQVYDILMRDGHPFLVKQKLDENYYGMHRLHSFVGPNKILYRVDHRNGTESEALALVPAPDETCDLQITFEKQGKYYNQYIKYVFADNGTKLFDREDEFDWRPLNELPAIPIQEISSHNEMINSSFLTLYTPSGNIYHIFTNETSASIAIEKGSSENLQPLYISYFQIYGEKSNIYLSSDGHPSLEHEDGVEINETEWLYFFFLKSFVTPDQKKFQIEPAPTNGRDWIFPSQVKEPVDLTPEDGLTIIIQNINGWRNIYRFTWNGDKLIEDTLAPPELFLNSKVLGSLIGK